MRKLTEYEYGYLTGILLFIVSLFISQITITIIFALFEYMSLILYIAMFLDVAICFRIYFFVKRKVERRVRD